MKKALALVLVAMMVFGMTSVAFAATNNVKMIDGDTYPAFVDATGGAWDDPDDVLSSLEPDSELKLWLNPQAFRDGTDPLTNDQCYGTGGTTNNGGAMSESVLRREKITVRRSLSKGGSLLDSVGFDSDSSPSNAVFGSGKASYVSVEFVEHFVSTSSQDFDYTIYLCLDGSRVKSTEIVIAGTMENPDDEVYEDDDYCSGEDGTIIKAQDYVRGIEMYLGDGVSAHLNMFKGTKYYGTASAEVSSADDAVLNQYPSIDTVYVIRQVNLNGASVKFTFDMDDTYYVYNADGNYIGTTADELPYSAKYYLSTDRITMGSDSSSEPTEGGESSTAPVAPVNPEQPGMGGDDL